MSARGTLAASVLALALVSSAAFETAANAADAPSDTLLHDFLRGLADSTDVYFGASGIRPDTTGLDSTLAARLPLASANGRIRGSARGRLTWAPDLGFNRVDGPVYGGRVFMGRRYGAGRFNGGVSYAVGPNDTRWGGGWAISRARGPATWTLGLDYARESRSMDRDATDLRLAQLRAFLSGADTRRYFLRDGAELSLERSHPLWRARAKFRVAEHDPLAVTTSWNLAGSDLSVPDNLVAAHGQSREFEYELTARLGKLPYYAEINHVTSGQAIGSDFEFRRTRLSLAGDVGVGRWLAVVPQLEYGRLTGEANPQSLFFLGGSKSLRSIHGSSLAGTGEALARLDAILLPDFLTLLRVPHPAALPLQLAAFGAIGTVWGRDPFGGPPRVEEHWPEHGDWLPEAGLSLLYRPGLPDPSGFLRISWANALGPNRGGSRVTISYSRGVDLVNPLRSDD